MVQRGQAQAKALGKGCHSGTTRPRPAERQDGGHRGAQDSVITSTSGSRRPPLVRITCTRCSPSKWPIVGALPAQLFGERPRASINRASLHKGKGREEKEKERGRLSRTHRTSSRTPLARSFFPLYCSSSALEAIHHTTHWSRVLYHDGGTNLYKSCVSCVVYHASLESR